MNCFVEFFGQIFKPPIRFVYGCVELEETVYGLGKMAHAYGLQLGNRAHDRKKYLAAVYDKHITT